MNYEKTIGGGGGGIGLHSVGLGGGGYGAGAGVGVGGHGCGMYRHKNGVARFWNDRIMERFIKANLFIICCVAAGLLLIVYLGAFSCEVSWILEARGDLPTAAFILCAQYFIVFVATTILIHGLVTGLPWGLFAWSVVIGLLSIPELIFVMIMTTQHWGLQSVHGLTELVSYLIRLVINCFALICVIPTGLRWRRESQVLCQLQGLATRLQLQTPPPSVPPITKADSRRSSARLPHANSSSASSHAAFENAAFQLNEPAKMQLAMYNNNNSSAQTNNNGSIFGSQNEFNASMFSPSFGQQGGNGGAGGMAPRNGHRAQSLMDLRCTLPGMYNPRYVLDTEDKNGKYFNITIDDLKNNLQDSHKPPSLIGSTSGDPIYCSIEPKHSPPLPKSGAAAHHQHQQAQQHHPQPQSHAHPHAHLQQHLRSNGGPAKLSRNCISLENLDGIAKVQNDLAAYGNNLLQNYTQQQQYYLAMLSGYLPAPHAPMLGNSFNVYRRPVSMGGGGSSTQLNGHGPAAGFAGTVLAQPMPRRNSHQQHNQQQLQYYGGFGYANYTNPYITANSKLSLGNESDDYRKYRDVAL